MRRFDDYATRYRYIRMRRTDGILEMALHSSGQSLLWNDGIHEELLERVVSCG